jgi:hypothetical protein
MVNCARYGSVVLKFGHMENTPETEEKSMFQEIRDAIFPIKPVDSAPVKTVKNIAFFLFMLCVSVLFLVVIVLAL